MNPARVAFVLPNSAPYWCFHDRDIAPEGATLAETNKNLDQAIAQLAKELQKATGVKLLWGTANLFSHPRYMCGASTNPDAHVFAYAAAQVKKGPRGHAAARRRRLRVLGRPRRLQDAAQHRHEARARSSRPLPAHGGRLQEEDRLQGPVPHRAQAQGADQAPVRLRRRHGASPSSAPTAWKRTSSSTSKPTTPRWRATPSSTSWSSVQPTASSAPSTPTPATCCSAGTPTSSPPTSTRHRRPCSVVLNQGGFTTGGMNFDAKVRRESFEPIDLFHAHIGGMDAFARGLHRRENRSRHHQLQGIGEMGAGGRRAQADFRANRRSTRCFSTNTPDL